MLRIFIKTALILILSCHYAAAAPLKVFVSEFNATGIQNKDEMKGLLQSMLASRLNSPSIVTVDKAADSDLTVTGSYLVIGKIFSIDAVARTSGGQVLTRSFMQGDSQDELIPAVGKLADKLSAELVRLSASTPATAPTPSPASNDIIRSSNAGGTVQYAPTGDIITKQALEKSPPSGWLSKRIQGALNLIALGSRLPDGAREIFTAQNRIIQYYRQSGDMQLISSIELSASEKIVSLDVADADANGAMEVYASVIRNGEPSSYVYEVRNDKIVKIAESLQYLFRAVAVGGDLKKLYAQQFTRDGSFYGDVYEVSRSGATISLKTKIKMPRFGNIYTFNKFKDKEGRILTVVINPDNYLIVYDPDFKEIWRSNDKFGGSELYFQQEDIDGIRITGSRYRNIFMEQKILVTTKNEVLVGKNEGFWVIGDVRSYKKGAVYAFEWDGNSLEERWRTRETQNYMPEFVYDEEKGELLLLQLTQRDGFGTSAASALAIRKVQ